MTTVVFGYYNQENVKEEEDKEEEEEERSVVDMGQDHHHHTSSTPVPIENHHPYMKQDEESEVEFCENLFDSLDIIDPKVKTEEATMWFGTNEDIFWSSGWQQQQLPPPPSSLVCDEVLNDTFDSSEGTLSDSTQTISPPSSPSPQLQPPPTAHRRRARQQRQPRHLRNAWLTRRERKKITKKKPLVPTPIILKGEESIGIRPGHYKISAMGRLGLVRPWNIAMDEFPEKKKQKKNLIRCNLFSK
jgi:hypothetical protein